MRAWAIVVKELKEIFRDVGGLIMLFVVPIVLLFVFNFTMSGAFQGPGERPFRVPVANLDRGDIGATLVEQLDSSEWIAVESENAEGEPLSEEEAVATVEGGRRNQAVVIPPDFSEKIAAGERVDITVVIDGAVPSQYTGPVIGALQGAIFGATFGEQMRGQFPEMMDRQIDRFEEDQGFTIPPSVRESLISSDFYQRYIADSDLSMEFNADPDDLLAQIVRVQPPSVEREQFPTVYQQTASGYAIMFVFFIIMHIGSSFLLEQQGGTFRRLLAAPVGRYTILVGKLFPNVIVNFLQVAIMFGASMLFFGIDLGNSPLGIFLITLCLSLSACGLGLLIATLFRTHTQLSGMGVLIVLTTSALSGAMVPRFIMGEFVQQVGLVCPQTWALIAYQEIMVRGRGLIDVLPHCGMLLGFAAIFLVVALLRFRFE